MNKGEKKRTIGIITYHRAINYGAILQLYALQKKIKDLGAKSVVIDYRNKKLENNHKKMKLSECKKVKDFARYLFLSKHYNNKYDKFRNFSSRYFSLSEPFYNALEIKEKEKKYYRFITGSDQVWNYKINGMDTTYLLDFVRDKNKKASYAASFGVKKIPEEYRQKYKDLLKDFSFLSVREKQGAQLLKDLISREAEVVLDPTLLLSKEEWYNLAKKSFKPHLKYILVYAFGRSSNIFNLANHISKKTGYKIVYISNTYNKNLKIYYVKSAGPEEFLDLFKNAEYIITNSFHGTAFSINFNKQFFIEMLPESLGVNSRLEDLLKLFGLQNRIITSSDADIINEINYEKVNTILEIEREKSINFLKNIIS